MFLSGSEGSRLLDFVDDGLEDGAEMVETRMSRDDKTHEKSLPRLVVTHLDETALEHHPESRLTTPPSLLQTSTHLKLLICALLILEDGDDSINRETSRLDVVSAEGGEHGSGHRLSLNSEFGEGRGDTLA